MYEAEKTQVLCDLAIIKPMSTRKESNSTIIENNSFFLNMNWKKSVQRNKHPVNVGNYPTKKHNSNI